MTIEQKINRLEINIVALRKAADEQFERLAELKKETERSASPVRRNLKQKRIEDIAKNYMVGKWKQNKHKTLKN